jgi:hypothetical protein
MPQVWLFRASCGDGRRSQKELGGGGVMDEELVKDLVEVELVGGGE